MSDKWQELRRVCEATGWKWVSVGVPRPELRDLLAERDTLEAERDDHLQECRSLIASRDALAQEVERLRAAFRGLQSVAVAAQGQWGVPADLMTAFKELAESLDRQAATGPDSDGGEAG